MLYKLTNAFTKVTAWPFQKLIFRTKVLYEDPAAQKRHIRGGAILISNHTSVFDYAAYLFVFFTRTLRFQMAEVLFRKKFLGPFLRLLGGIYIDRDARDMRCIVRSEEILRHGGVVGIFPEGRLPRPQEERPLPFQHGAAYLALSCGVPVIPVVTNGCYFTKKRAAVLIGTPMDVSQLTDETLSEKENLIRVTQKLRERIIRLRTMLEERCGEAEQ